MFDLFVLLFWAMPSVEAPLTPAAYFTQLGPCIPSCLTSRTQPWSLLATDFREVVLAMLSPNPEDRPDVATVAVALRGEWLIDCACHAMVDDAEYSSE